MVDIFIPNKSMQGKAVNSPGHPDHGRILLKNKSGVVEGSEPIPGYGLSWAPFTGGDVTAARDPGFLPVEVFGDTKRIYIAKVPYSHGGTPVTPNDSNDGLSPLTPKFSELAAVQLLEQGRSCHLYFRADENHNDVVYNIDDSGSGKSNFRNNLVGGESAAKPTVIGWYGTQEGARPKVRPPISLGVDSRHSYMWWDGIHFYKEETDPNHPNFTGASAGKIQYLGKDIQNIVLQDCELSGVEIAVQNNDQSTMQGLIVHRCIGHYVYYNQSSINNTRRPSFAYVYKLPNTTFTDNVSKWAGWHPDVAGAGPNQFNHWLYYGETDPTIQVDSLLVKHNIIFEPSAHSWQLRGGGTAEENISIGASIGPTFGYLDRNNLEKGLVADGTQFHSIRNITLDAQSMRRVENGCQNSVCTTARWGHANTFNSPNVVHTSTGDVIARVVDNIYDGSLSSSPQVFNIPEVTYGITDISAYPQYSLAITGRVIYHYSSSTQGDELNLLEPTRDVGSYLTLLADGATLDNGQAIDFLLSRPKSAWDAQYAPSTIHAWVYAGYQPQ